MADQRSKMVIDQLLASKNKEPYPSPETLYALVQDTEDILFISKCSVSWEWMKGKSKIFHSNNHSVFLLTRQRLIIVGGELLPFQSIQQLGDVYRIFESRFSDVRVEGLRTLANDPPNPPNEQSGYRTYPKDERKEIAYELMFQNGSVDLRAKLFEAVRALPYPIFVKYDDPQKDSFPREVSSYLPMHQDIELWNRLIISREALITVARWIQNGEAFPGIGRVNELLQPNEGIFYLAQFLVEYNYPSPIDENRSKRPHWWEAFKAKRNRNTLPNNRRIPNIVIVTDQRILFFNEQNFDERDSISFDDINEIVDVKDGSIYRGILNSKLEIHHKQKNISLLSLNEQEKPSFLKTIQATCHGNKVIPAMEKTDMDEIFILKPFESSPIPNIQDGLFSLPNRDPLRSGYVYILINPQLPLDTLKIGKTTRRPEDRANEIFSTGVPGEFVVAYEEHVLDCHKAEAEIHSRLASYRISSQREFFRLPLKVAVRVVHEVALEIGIIE